MKQVLLLCSLALLSAGCGAPDDPAPAADEDDLGESLHALCESATTGYTAQTPYCGSISDAWTKASVNVGWYPYRAKRRRASTARRGASSAH